MARGRFEPNILERNIPLNQANKMETKELPLSKTGLTLGRFFVDLLPKILEQRRQIKSLREKSIQNSCLMPESVPPQASLPICSSTLRNKLPINDVNEQSKGNSTASEDPENKKQKKASDISDNSSGATGLQRARRTNAIAGSLLKNTETKESSVKVKFKEIRFLLIALIMLVQLPDTGGHSVQIVNITIAINQSVSLPADANEEDHVEWFLSPQEDPSQYFRLYDSGEIPRKDGCSQYEFAQNHSMFIASAQPCHSGTYTVDVFEGDSKSFMLTVDSSISSISMEASVVSDTTSHSPATIASNKRSNDLTTIILAVVLSVACMAVLAIVFVIIKLCLAGKCKRIGSKAPSSGNNNDATYTQVSSGENV